MDAITLLEQQHAAVDDLLDRFDEARDDQERAEVVRLLVNDLRAHATIEEELFYPVLRERLGLHDQVLEDLEEHHLVDVLLDELEGMDPTDERFAAKVEVLAELVDHHVEEEEEDLFPAVRRGLDEDVLTELGRRMQQRSEELHFDDDVVDITKEELYQQARELDLPGRAQMTKRQLASALSRLR